MSTVQGGQGNIVTNGLVLNLDAANPRSYAPPFNGITWQNLVAVSSSISGSLVNGASYTGSNNGTLVFDGVDDFVDISSFPTINQITCDIWLKVDPSNITGALVAGWGIGIEGIYRIIYNTTGFSWVCRAGSGWYSPGTAVDSSILSPFTNIWFNVVGTYNGSFNSIYVNSILQSTGSIISGTVSGGGLNIGKGVSNIAYQKGNTSISRIYNRALSASEVLQNFNATRARFGI
jgi:hypothetical protein